MNDLREWSRHPRLPAVANAPTVEEQMLGCWQRIADAVERMAGPKPAAAPRFDERAIEVIERAALNRYRSLPAGIKIPAPVFRRAIVMAAKSAAGAIDPYWWQGDPGSAAVDAGIKAAASCVPSEWVARIGRQTGSKEAARLAAIEKTLREAGL